MQDFHISMIPTVVCKRSNQPERARTTENELERPESKEVMTRNQSEEAETSKNEPEQSEKKNAQVKRLPPLCISGFWKYLHTRATVGLEL